jgi:hypothetical protein
MIRYWSTISYTHLSESIGDGLILEDDRLSTCCHHSRFQNSIVTDIGDSLTLLAVQA